MIDYVANILAVYDAASDQALIDGRTWYRSMYRIMREHAATSTLTVAQVAAIYAATSINITWARNMELAARAIADFADGIMWTVRPCTSDKPCKRVKRGLTCLGHGTGYGTIGTVVRKVGAIMRGANIDATLSSGSNYKLANFAANLAGDYSRVTVDRWAYRIATGDNEGVTVPTGKLYIELAAAYVEAAKLRNVNPATMQAATWCAIRGKGN